MHRPPIPEDAVERAEREPDPHTPERTLSAFEERRRLQLALEELPAEQREAVLLRLEQDLSLDGIDADDSRVPQAAGDDEFDDSDAMAPWNRRPTGPRPGAGHAATGRPITNATTID